MNRQRRAALIKVWVDLIQALDTLTELRDQEQQAVDNLPASLKETDNAVAADEAILCLDTAINTLEETIEIISDTAEGGTSE